MSAVPGGESGADDPSGIGWLFQGSAFQGVVTRARLWSSECRWRERCAREASGVGASAGPEDHQSETHEKEYCQDAQGRWRRASRAYPHALALRASTNIRDTTVFWSPDDAASGIADVDGALYGGWEERSMSHSNGFPGSRTTVVVCHMKNDLLSHLWGALDLNSTHGSDDEEDHVRVSSVRVPPIHTDAIQGRTTSAPILAVGGVDEVMRTDASNPTANRNQPIDRVRQALRAA